MIFFKTEKGELVPFTAPLMKEVFSVNWPDEYVKHRAFRLTCHNKVLYSYCTGNYRNLIPMAETAMTYVFEAIESLIEDGEVMAIVNIKELVEDLEDAAD